MSLKSIKLIYNNYVRDDWSTYSKVNGQHITRYQGFVDILVKLATYSG